MSNLKYKINKLNTKSWIKYWLYKKFNSSNYQLSTIKENTFFAYLDNTVDKKFNIFKIKGQTILEKDVYKNTGDEGYINIVIKNANLINIDEIIRTIATDVVKNDDGSIDFTISSSPTIDFILDTPISNYSRFYWYLTNITGSNFYIEFIYNDNYNNRSSPSSTGNNERRMSYSPNTSHESIVKIRFGCYATGRFKIRNFMCHHGAISSYPYIESQKQIINFPLKESQIFGQGYFLSDDGVHFNETIEPYDERQQIEYNKIKNLKTFEGQTYITSNNHIEPKFRIQYWESVER